MTPHKIFVDGGLLGPKNPSKLGGTWAYCWVDEQGEMIRLKSGLILPGEHNWEAGKTVSNNFSELAAAYMGLCSVGFYWPGTIYTDSKVTWWRITTGQGFAGIPSWLQESILEIRESSEYQATLIAGHPTARELEQGFAVRKSYRLPTPVSKFNCLCDEECQRLAREFMNGRKG